jgi:hypothetical protein
MQEGKRKRDSKKKVKFDDAVERLFEEGEVI